MCYFIGQCVLIPARSGIVLTLHYLCKVIDMLITGSEIMSAKNAKICIKYPHSCSIDIFIMFIIEYLTFTTPPPPNTQNAQLIYVKFLSQSHHSVLLIWLCFVNDTRTCNLLFIYSCCSYIFFGTQYLQIPVLSIAMRDPNLGQYVH